MSPLGLALRSLGHYWRTNLAVITGVAVAVSVLSGALLVGDSVRASLRRLAVARLGATDHLIASTRFFRDALSRELVARPEFTGRFEKAVGLIAVDGLVSRASGSGRASDVAIYGVDESFWTFHGVTDAPRMTARQALVSPALARELNASAGDPILLRLRQPSAIPASTLHGRRDEVGQTMRATVAGIVAPQRMGEFSLRPQQGDVRAAFLPLDRVQRDLERDAQINAILVSAKSPDSGQEVEAAAAITRVLDRVRTLDDAGLEVRERDTPPTVVLESASGLLSDAVAARAMAAARSRSVEPVPVLSYLAHTIRVGEREIPYSVVSGLPLERTAELGPLEPETRRAIDAGRGLVDPIWLNQWAADALAAKPGNRVHIAYDLWEDGGGIVSRSADFTLAGVFPMRGIGADPTLTPDYPGITDQDSVTDWDPSFPVDLSRITPRDEQYWDQYRAAPKAFVRLETGQRLWASRFGRLTSLRFAPTQNVEAAAAEYRSAIAAALTPGEAGFVVQPIRARALEAASGTTDFGQYFLYFSFFLVLSGLLLAGLFFRLAVEQRLREIGVLEAIGLTPRAVRGLFFREGLILSAAGSAIGALGAIAYAALIMWGLRTWWVGAVGTTALEVRPSAIPLLTGAVAGLVTSLLWIAWALWRAARAPARSLLKGALDIESLAPRPRRHARAIARVVIGSLVVIALLSAATFGWVGRTAGFFGAGAAALATALAALGLWLRKDPTQPAPGAPWRGLGRLGLGNARARAGRTALATALIAFATFVIVSVGAFRREGPRDVSDKTSGTGGFAVIAESVAPLLYDPGMSQGREAYGLDSPELQSVLAGATFARFRLRPGDDGSCLNLYRPENPRILGVPEPFVSSGGRFTFAASLAATEAERHNPWRLLDRDLPGGVIPAIVDATSLTYVFHKRLGDEMAIERSSGQPVTLRFVASLSHSIFQSELLIADRHFVRLFPDNEGFRVWLVDVAPARAARVMEALEDRLSDAGVEARGTDERLRAYERVENTYLSTFQALGALGLVLGTLGVGAVLLRNVLERQREIALLQAVGYQEHHVRWIVLAETALIVLTGVAIGIACALLAVQPALAEHGGRTPWLAVATVVVAVAVTGWLASVAATSVALRLPILSSLKSE